MNLVRISPHRTRLVRAVYAITLAIACACMVAAPSACIQAEADTIFASGSGTSSDPYRISNTDELLAFRDSVNAGTNYAGEQIALTADLNISGTEWIPIGFSTRSGSGVTGTSTPFAGTFNGNNHTIIGLTITTAGSSSINTNRTLGLFGAVMGGTVQNLLLTDVNLNAPTSELAGGAVGLLGSGGTVSGVQVSGSVQALCGCGGIVGRMTAEGTITSCVNAASVTATGGTGNCGGIVGAAYYSPEGSLMTITDCVNRGTVRGLNDAGGIAGLCCAFVSGCTNEGAVIGSGYATGGIAGEMKNRGCIIHCTNSAAVKNESDASPYGTGGIVGWVRYDGAAPAYALSAPIDIADNLNTGTVSAMTGVGVGGIAGTLYSAGTVTGNENRAASLDGKQFIGGIVGNLQDQGASSLPAAVPEGAHVVNNVSTTPLSSMSGSLADRYAYNNDASLFTVQGNGPAWVAQRSSTGGTPYASLAYAMAGAADGDTITLVADSAETGMLAAQADIDTTIDLNGCDIAFTPNSGISATGDTVTITGTGDVYTRNADGMITTTPVPFITEPGADGTEGRILLEGGTYPTDVAAYVAPGYQEHTLEAPNALGNRYEIVAASTPNQPGSSSGSGSTTNPSQPMRPVKRPLPLRQPGASAPAATQTRAPQVASGVSMPPLSDNTGTFALALALLGSAGTITAAAAVVLRKRREHAA